MWGSLKNEMKSLYHWTTLDDLLGCMVFLGAPLAMIRYDILDGWYGVVAFLFGAYLIHANRNWMRSVRNRSLLQ